jgi:hypothetical protein
MNNDRKQVLKENLDTLKDRLLQIDAIRRRAQDELDHMPDVELLEDLRDHYSDAVDNLDSLKSDLEYLVKRIDLELNGPSDPQPKAKLKVEMDCFPEPEPEPEKPGFFTKLMIGLFAGHVAHKAHDHFEKERQEREQRRHDSIFWQEAARRDDPTYDDEDSEDW